MAIRPEDVVADAIVLAAQAREQAIQNGFGHIIPVIVEGALAISAARHTEQGLLAIARAIEGAGVDQGLQVDKICTAIGKCNTL